MERIIYNNKFRKIFIVTIIVMLLINFLMPCMVNLVYAAQFERTHFYPTPSGSVTKVEPDKLKDYYLDRGYTEQQWNEININWNYDDWDLDESQYQNVNSGGNSNPDLPPIDILEGTDYDPDYNIVSITVAITAHNDSLKEAYDWNQEHTNTSEKKTLVDSLNKAIDAAVSSGNAEEDRTTPDPEESANIGGILLSPVFYLVNFIADAVINITGCIMDPDNQELNLGVGVLSVDKPNPGYTATEDYEVNVSSFIPTNIIGGFSGDGSILYQYPNLTYTPEEIFSGKIDLLSIDFISGKNGAGDAITDSTEQGKNWLNIRKVVSQWYQVLRMVAIIGLLSVLIYTGIKIIISANAKDKAKYKEWIMNWFMAVAILFSMHLIMAFVVSITGEFSKLMTNACQGIHVIPSDNPGHAFDTNLMGLVRFMIQSENFYIKIGYEVMYIALICYTLKFTFTYLKRVLSMAFLTLIAPIVALTYPIDKVNDGKAQGFDMWLKEYIFNALLQPMHCILYYVLVGSAVSIAATNPLYGIIVLAFMSEAEKLLKKIFGFEKAGGGTVGGMTGAFAAGAVASSIAKLAKLPKGNAGKGGSGGSGDASQAGNYLDNFKEEKLGNKGNLDESFSDSLLDSGDVAKDKSTSPEGAKDVDNSTKEGKSEAEDPRLAAYRKDGYGQNADGHYFNPSIDEYDEDYDPRNDQMYNQNKKVENSRQNNSKPSVTPNNEEKSIDNGTPIQSMAAKKAAQKQAETPKIEGAASEDKTPKSKSEKRKAGLKNVGKTLIKPIYDADRKGTGYNTHRWKRRGVNALKGVGKAYLGASLGVAAAAVQAGISITDGKYNPMEGVAAFTAGYAGGGSISSSIGRKWSTVSNAFKEGYYDGDNDALLEKRKEQHMLDDKVFNTFNKKYGDKGRENVVKKMRHARDHMVEYGITDPKQQIGVEEMAQKLIKGKNTEGMTTQEKEELEKRAYKQARDTYGFINQLEKQGVGKKIIKDPGAQEKYIDSYIKAKGLGKDDPKADEIRNSLNNAFRSAAVWQQVNPKL